MTPEGALDDRFELVQADRHRGWARCSAPVNDLRRTVAVKIISECKPPRRRFARRGVLLAAAVPPRARPLFAHGVTSAGLFLAMEWSRRGPHARLSAARLPSRVVNPRHRHPRRRRALGIAPARESSTAISSPPT